MFTRKNTKVFSHKAIAHATKHVSMTSLFSGIWDSKNRGRMATALVCSSALNHPQWQ